MEVKDPELKKKELEKCLKEDIQFIMIEEIHKREKTGENTLENRYVYSCKKVNDDQKKYCIKIIDVDSYGSSNEENILNKLKENKSRILYKCEVVKKNPNKYIISELYGGSIANYIREKDKNKPFNLEEIRHIMKDVVFGLSLLNSLGINHRDIKPDNLVINYKEENRNQDLLKSEIIIIDYGLGIFNNEGKNKKVGTKGYMHPRIESIENLNQELDIWSSGVTCLELFCGKLPKFENGNYRIPLNENTKLEFVRFVDNMLQEDPNKQIKINKLSEEPFLNNPIESFKNFTKEIGGNKYKEKEGYIELNYQNGLNFIYEEKEDYVDELINDCFIKLNENCLFTKPVLFPMITDISQKNQFFEDYFNNDFK